MTGQSTPASAARQRPMAHRVQVICDGLPHNGIQCNVAAIGQKDQWSVLFVELVVGRQRSAHLIDQGR